MCMLFRGISEAWDVVGQLEVSRSRRCCMLPQRRLTLGYQPSKITDQNTCYD
jgi:hypothetical protein